MQSIRIHYRGREFPHDLSPVDTLRWLAAEPGWARIMSSSRSGATPVYYRSGIAQIMWDWTQSAYNDFLILWPGSTIVVELEDDVAEEVRTLLHRNTVNPPPALVQGR